MEQELEEGIEVAGGALIFKSDWEPFFAGQIWHW